jgi:hypothetical protein
MSPWMVRQGRFRRGVSRVGSPAREVLRAVFGLRAMSSGLSAERTTAVAIYGAAVARMVAAAAARMAVAAPDMGKAEHAFRGPLTAGCHMLVVRSMFRWKRD